MQSLFPGFNFLNDKFKNFLFNYVLIDKVGLEKGLGFLKLFYFVRNLLSSSLKKIMFSRISLIVKKDVFSISTREL